MNIKKKIITLSFFGLLILILIFYFFSAYNLKKDNSPFIEYSKLFAQTFRIGFKDLNEEFNIDNLEIHGDIPKWISGTLFRNGPGKFTLNKNYITNWFDGFAMIHAFTLQDGKVSYKNKILKTDDYENSLKNNKINFVGFLQDPCKSIFRDIFSIFFVKSNKNKINNANVNIAKYTNHFIALTETPLPVEFDKKSLETIGLLNYNDDLPKYNIHDTAHPHYDPFSKEHLGYFTKFGIKSSHNLFKIKFGQTERQIIGSFQTKEPSYMHSFGLTKNYAILTALPLVANPISLILNLQNRGFINNFKWKPQLGTNFLVFNRIQNKFVNKFKTEPFFAFHVVNAFEKDNNIIIDIVTYPDISIINKAYFSYILNPLNYKKNHNEFNGYGGILKRFTIDLISSKVNSEILLNEQIELPRINYNYNAQDYKFIYAYSNFNYPFTAEKLLKFNLNNKEIKSWQEDNCFPGEPVFIENPNLKSEDGGVILSVVLNAKEEKSFLLILDAKTFKEIARCLLPHHIPFGIHGQFFNK